MVASLEGFLSTPLALGELVASEEVGEGLAGDGRWGEEGGLWVVAGRVARFVMLVPWLWGSCATRLAVTQPPPPFSSSPLLVPFVLPWVLPEAERRGGGGRW